MTHLVDKINTNKQNISGKTTININDINDVTISNLQTNDMLKYSNSSFNNSPSDVLNPKSSYPLTNGYSVSTATDYQNYTYFESPFYLACRHNYYTVAIMDFFNDSDNTILKPNLNSNSGYITGVSIKANQPTLLFCYSALSEDSDSTAYIDLQWQTVTGTPLGPITRFMRLENNNRNTVIGYINSSVDVDVGLKRLTGNSSYGWMMSSKSRENFIMIAKRVL
jgi:hypothetical protein